MLGKRKRLRFPGFFAIMGCRAMLAHLIECVRHSKPPSMSLEVARRDMQIVFAAYRSLESGAFEAVGPTSSGRLAIELVPRIRARWLRQITTSTFDFRLSSLFLSSQSYRQALCLRHIPV